jgi:EmrB/QacA subfamily drug resistance transporter
MLTDRQKWWVLAVLLVGQLMIVLDVSVVNVALPTIARELHFSQTSLAWVVNAYLITFGGLLLLAGRFSDLVGRRKVFLSGMAVFTVASALCGIATTGGVLIFARFLQGAGAAMIAAVVLGIMFALFTTHVDRAMSLGYYGVVGAAGASIGLIVGGTITQFINWHWIFYINVPFGIAAFVLGLYLIPKDVGAGNKKGLDFFGATLLVGALVSLIYSIIEAGDIGWLASPTLLYFFVALVLLFIFYVWEQRAQEPLLPFSIFKTHNLIEANVAFFFVLAPLIGAFFLTALYLQNVLGLDAFQTGLAFIPQMLAYGGMGLFVVPKVLAKFGGKKMLYVGLPIFALAMADFAVIPAHANYWLYIASPMLLYAIGGTLTSTALSSLGMSEVGQADTGLASGILNTSRQVGSAIGVALLASIAAMRTSDLLAKGATNSDALASGYRLGFAVSAGLVLLAGVISLRLKPHTNDAQEIAVKEEQYSALDI